MREHPLELAHAELAAFQPVHGRLPDGCRLEDLLDGLRLPEPGAGRLPRPDGGAQTAGPGLHHVTEVVEIDHVLRGPRGHRPVEGTGEHPTPVDHEPVLSQPVFAPDVHVAIVGIPGST